MSIILIIEDEEAVRQNLAEVLTLEGYSIIQAENGLVGTHLAKDHPPDLIICDINMPELDGFGVLTTLQDDPLTATIPFIFLTAMADKRTRRRGMELGADDYLTKPFTSRELVATVRKRLAKHAAITGTFKAVTDHETDENATMLSSAKPSGGNPGVSLLGRILRGYQIREIIGEGGAGTVYKAYQPSIGREVAIKVLRMEFAGNPEFIHRFQTEAELVARLEHPHIIPLYDYWHDERGVYIVMRWLRGGNLRAMLSQSSPIPLPQLVSMFNQIAAALSIAHKVNIIHRDLKPDNILLDEHGNIYLTDFGLAKNLVSTSTDSTSQQSREPQIGSQESFFEVQPTSTLYLTAYEGLLGTPAYLAPEQIRMERLAVQCDIYSLGITLYELLVGKAPFEGNVPDIIMQHLYDKPPSLRDQRGDLPEAVEPVIQKATEKDWKLRYDNVLTFAADFEKACASPLNR